MELSSSSANCVLLFSCLLSPFFSFLSFFSLLFFVSWFGLCLCSGNLGSNFGAFLSSSLVGDENFDKNPPCRLTTTSFSSRAGGRIIPSLSFCSLTPASDFALSSLTSVLPSRRRSDLDRWRRSIREYEGSSGGGAEGGGECDELSPDSGEV